MKISIFTPTYNRAYILDNAYQSLKRQTDKNFEWIIIDDGSEDDTRNMVEAWKAEGEIDIHYQYKENGGMHTAHNLGFEMASGDLVFCLDSDDDLDAGCVARLLDQWKRVADKGYIGIVCNERYRETNNVIGSEFPEGLESVKFTDIYYKYFTKGDKLLVFKPEVARRFPYPSFPGERFVPLDYKYLLLDGKLSVLNESLYIKEYLSDGYSKNINQVYARNPKGFGFYHEERLNHDVNFLTKMKSVVHSTACSLLSNEYKLKFDFYFLMRVLLFFPGYMRFMILKRERQKLGTHKTTV